MWRALQTTLAIGCLAGCGTQSIHYVYQPTAQVSAATAGFPRSHYEVPAEKPSGEVDLTTFGIIKMQISDAGPVIRFLHVRLVVTNNNDDGPWMVDTREQLLELGDEGKSCPAYVNTDVRSLPRVEVPPASKRTLDLYYALPSTMQTTRRIPSFDVVWHVATPSVVVTERTPFERLAVKPDVVRGYYPNLQVGVEVGWGPVWWYDPFVVRGTFRHPVVPHVREPVLVRHANLPPRRIYVVAPPPSRRPM